MILGLLTRCKYVRLFKMNKENLKKVGLKTTLPRLKILQLLEDNKNNHLSAEQIQRTLANDNQDIGLATVYRVLGQFEKAGLVIRHKFDEESFVYELDRGNHHDHMICVKCNVVVEFVDQNIEDRQKEIASQHGFIITEHKLNIFGFCNKCK